MAAPARVEDVYPLSPLQEGLLFHALEPEQGLYVTQLACTLRGLAVEPFWRAWREVVDRHPALRSAFAWKSADRPLQIVSRRVDLPIHEEDWRGSAPGESEARLAAFLAGDRAAGLALRRAPLLRLALFRTGEDEHRLVWTYHHLIVDGWCRQLVLREVMTLYHAHREGGAAALPPAPPYRDYIAWLGRQDLGRAEAFWRTRLSGVEAAPAPSLVPAGGGEAGDSPGEREVVLAAGEALGLRGVGRRHRLTPSTLAHGVWALLLARLDGGSEALFGTVVSGRPADLPGAETMVGLLANTLPVRLPLAPEQPATGWLAEVQAALAELRQFEYSPLSQVRRWSGLPAGGPLFETLLAFENYPDQDAVERLGGSLGIADVRSYERASFPLAVAVLPGEAWRIQAAYDGRRYAAAAVERLLGWFRSLLAALAEDPERAAGDLPWLSEAERSQLLVEWSGEAGGRGGEPPLVTRLIAARAAASPDRPAVVADGGVLPFGELVAAARRLARRLRRRGVGPEVVVGILADRQPPLLVAILAVLEAGGAILPLDPAYPAERLAAMLADSRAGLLLVQGAAAAAAPPGGPPRLDLDLALGAPGPAGETARREESGEFGAVDPAALAYVFFTSGSSGRPKGVAVDHGALAGYAVEMARQLGLVETDRMLQFASPAFDVLIEEVFPVWTRGGAVVLAAAEELVSPRRLAATLSRHGVTAVELPAVFWHQWVEELAATGAAPPPSLRLVLLGSEKPSGVRLGEWDRFRIPTLYVFGLTETSVTSCLHRVAPGGRDLDLPIGRPLDGVRLYAHDRRGQAVPAGVVGELAIGGRGLARGYLGNPDLTALRFAPDPRGERGDRLFLSGDRVRHRLDGSLEFLGRLDGQVKVRGLRVELGEIEALLARHPAVREAAVMVREERAGDRRLVAYVASGAAEPPSFQELRAFLARSLPEPLLPSAFVAIAELPLTANGKIDRAALPAPPRWRGEDGAAGPDAASAVPRSAMERRLAEIWQQVLGVAQIGIHDNFFELGGDSILSIQIASRAHRAGLEVAPWQILRNPTIARLAAGLTAGPGPPAASEAEAAGPVALTPIQAWLLAQPLAAPGHWNMPVLLAPRRRLALPLLERALARAVERHDALRLRFERGAGGWRQEVVAAAPAVRLARVDLTALPARRRLPALAAAAERIQAGLDLAQPPLLRAAWLDLGAEEARLLLVAHHLTVDAVSWRLLVAELSAACAPGAGGSPAGPGSSFAAFARGLARHAAAGGFDGELDWWLALARQPPVPLPLDFPGGDNRQGSARTVRVELDEEETRSLLKDVPRAYRTQINDVLLTALLLAVHGWTGTRRLVVELEGHGRECVLPGVDPSQAVGWLATLFPVALELPAAAPGEQLRAVKEQLRAVPGQGLGWGALRYLAARRELAEAASPPILFNYLGTIDEGGEEEGLFALANEAIGESIDPGSARSHLLEVNARVAGGRLAIALTYGSSLFAAETMVELGRGFAGHLRRLIAHCLAAPAGGRTPSDFPLAALDQAGLDRLLARLATEVEDLYPLSPLQRGMLFHSLYEPGDGVYVAQLVFGLDARTDRAALRRAWEEVAARHAALRTAFLWQDLDAPLQAVVRRADLPWEEEDLGALPPAAQRGRLAAFLAADRARGFDPSRPPLLRLTLLPTAPGAAWLVVSLHQMALDGWSLPLLFADLLALYARETGADAAAEPPARPPYRDYIAWLQAQDDAAAESFWRRTLAGLPAATELGVPSPAAAAAGQGEAVVEVAGEPAAALRRLARGNLVTLGTVVHAAWALVLARFSGDEDVLFGSVVAGRPAALPGAEEMIGLFINTLPLRVRVPEDEPVAGWLRGLQDRQAEALRFQHSPLADVHRWSELPSGQALFESIVVFQNHPQDPAAGDRAGLGGLRHLSTTEQTNYPLTVVVQPDPRLRLSLSFSRRRIDAAAGSRLAGHLAALLAEMARAPEAPLGTLLGLSAGERHQLLHEWNDTRPFAAASAGTAAAEPATLHGLVEAQAARTPRAVAVRCGERNLTYEELELQANQLAWLLRSLAVGPEVPVGVCLERSPDLLVALLAILKAGGAYLPLDPELPALRIAAMLADAAVPLVVTGGTVGTELERRAGRRVVRLDSERAVLRRQPTGRPVAGVERKGAAYVIYTSGSTGAPKGAMNTHEAIVNRLLWMQERFALSAADRVLQKTSIAFDVSVWELFWPLATGATLVLARPGGQRDAGYLAALMRRERITAVHFVPSMLHAFLEEPDLAPGGAPLRLITSGEALSPELAARAAARLGTAPENLYGPTEAAVDVTAWRFRPGEDLRSVPIGYPIRGLRLHVLDRGLRPVPSGAAGELMIGGIGLARGYLRQPALTAERFIPDPVGAEPGARLYRTGDRARYRPDGALDFLGRLDFQVKIRGHRIEPAEIELALGQHPAIGETVVVVRADAGGRPQLAAFWTPAAGRQPPGPGELRRFLEERLPAPMVPAAFTPLAALPRGASGKLDRRALAALAASPSPAAAADDVGPRTPVEEKLAAVWAEVLGVERVTVRDNFFDLGGDSILSILVVSRAARMGLRLSPKQVLTHQTIERLAVQLALDAAGEGDERPQQGVVAGPVPVTPIQHWFLAAEPADPHHFNQTVLVDLRRPLSRPVLERALAALPRHHDALRLRVSRREGAADPGSWRQELAAPAGEGELLPALDLSRLAPAARDRALGAAAALLQASLDLAAGRLHAAALFHLGAGRDALLLTVHHLAVDAVSLRLLLEDLALAVDQVGRGEPVALPPKTTSFKRWAELLAERARGPAVEAELDHWLAATRCVAPLPRDLAAGPNTVGSASGLATALEAAETEALQEVAAEWRMRLDEMLLAALAQVLASWSGGNAAVVDVERHGREEIAPGVDLSRTVGWFTSLFPVRLEVPLRGDPGAALLAIKEQLRRVPGQGLGYGLLRYLRAAEAPGALLAGQPAAEVLFNFLGTIDRGLPPGSPFALAGEEVGPAASSRRRRSHPLQVDALVAGGRLRVVWTYSRNLHAAATVERLAAALLAGLRLAIERCRGVGAAGYVPAEFNLVDLEKSQLDRLARKYGGGPVQRPN